MQLRPHRLLLAAVLLTCSALAQAAQQPTTPMARDAHPSFAVAAIRPHDPSSDRQGINAKGDRFTVVNESVASMMQFAYAIHPRQIIGAPDWAFQDRWDIEGTTDIPGEPNRSQHQEMLQKLLADRFGLRFHRAQRDLSVYAIKIAKGGPKLTPAANPTARADQKVDGNSTQMTHIYTSAAMSDFAIGMQFFVSDRPIVDQTGLTGRYDFTLRYTNDEAHAADASAPPGLFTAIQEQLGLKLEPEKAPFDVFVIDHVERPSEN